MFFIPQEKTQVHAVKEKIMTLCCNIFQITWLYELTLGKGNGAKHLKYNCEKHCHCMYVLKSCIYGHDWATHYYCMKHWASTLTLFTGSRALATLISVEQTTSLVEAKWYIIMDTYGYCASMTKNT